MISRFKELSPNESAQATAILLKSLSSGDSGVRLTAAGVIAEIGDASNIPALEAAIAKEADPQLRRAMGYYLKQLQGNQP